MRLFTVSLVLLTLGLGSAAADESIRCQHDLVHEGDPVAHLLLRCGEPLLRQTIALTDTSETEGVVEQWTYDFGPGTFLTVVTIESGKVARIEEGDRR